MRRIGFTEGEYYHIFNRGNNKQRIFSEERDWLRFLFLVMYLQSPVSFSNPGRQVTYFVKHQMFNTKSTDESILKNRFVELVSFALMPNHFHLMVRELKQGGISQYMQKVLNAYTKYFNAKNEMSGHVFQGPFKAVHIERNEQLLYLSAYIHHNPKGMPRWRKKPQDFPWSSYKDYVTNNRWGDFLTRDIILNQFASVQEYEEFVQRSEAKEVAVELLID